ncbi:MAG: VWA domain-containing protein [Burkholderiales bacterium]
MSLQWPRMLWLLAAVPVVAFFYWRLLARRQAFAQRYAGLETVGGSGTPRQANLRRHIPGVLMLLGLTAMLLAVARPNAVIPLPSRVETIILAMDTSGSMRAADLKPDRITAAQTAAKAFIAEQPDTVRVGIVAVAGSAAVIQSPTKNRDDLVQAIDRIQLQRGTALGSGILISLITLLPEADIDAELIINGRSSRRPKFVDPDQPPPEPFKPVPPGSNRSTAIVLLSDGQSNVGPDPQKMAAMAAERGVRVFTVGMGTPEGITLSAEGWSMRVRLDEEALNNIATATSGEYFRAGDASDLKKIYRTLGAKLKIEKQETTEVTAVFAALGAALAMLAALLSMLWFNRIL